MFTKKKSRQLTKYTFLLVRRIGLRDFLAGYQIIRKRNHNHLHTLVSIIKGIMSYPVTFDTFKKLFPEPKSLSSFHATWSSIKSRRNNTKLFMSQRGKRCGHKVNRLKILPIVDIDLEDKVLDTTKINKHVANITL